MALLSGIVVRGSSTIQRQRQALTGRVAELSALLAQNRTLRRRVQKGVAQRFGHQRALSQAHRRRPA